MISVTSGVSRSANERKRSTRAGSTASSLKTGMTILSSGPPIRFMKCASSVTESRRKPSGIPEQTFCTLAHPLRIYGLVHPQVDDPAGESAGIRAAIGGLEKIVHRPVQVRYVKTITPDGIAEINQLIRKIHQQRITPANSALVPLVDSLPISRCQNLVVLLRVVTTMLERRLQLSPGGGQSPGVFHAAQIEWPKRRLQFEERRGYFVHGSSSQQSNQRMVKITIAESERFALCLVDFRRQRIRFGKFRRYGNELPMPDQQRSAAALQNLGWVEAIDRQIADR